MVSIDTIVEQVTSQIGNLETAYLTGDFAFGLDLESIELALIGKNLDAEYIVNLVNKAKNMIDRKIIYLVLFKEQMDIFFKDKPTLLIWKRD